MVKKKSLVKSDEWLVINSISEFFSLLGINKNAAKIWCIMFLKGEFLTAAQLHQLLEYSTGTISMALKELRKYEMIEKVIPGPHKPPLYKARLQLRRTLMLLINHKLIIPIEKELSTIEKIYYITKEAEQKQKLEELLQVIRIVYAFLKDLIVGWEVGTKEIKKFIE